ncbi:MAG TPA: SIMPL domain-containing protein [Dehalococcoidia bacterium]|nr:SIMPL domain-containing protein [Dehalococcoidia bacterium]
MKDGKPLYMTLALAAIAGLSLVAATCGTTTTVENNGEDPERGITVAGEGKVSAAPDIATIALGVSTLRPTVAEARDEAAAALDAMIASMKANGVEDRDIQTANLSIYPEYDYRNDQQILRGFRVTNTLTARVRDIDTTSTVVDDAITAGGDSTNIQSIAFSIDDPSELRAEARRQAVEDARGRAQVLADAGGVGLGDPIAISETGFDAPVFYPEAGRADSASGAAPPTPIEPGELDVTISVTVRFAIE